MYLRGAALILLFAPFTAWAQPAGDGVIGGTVVMQTTRELIPRALVYLDWLGTPRSQALERTDDAGRFTFRNLPPGRYRLRAQKRSVGEGAWGVNRYGELGRTLTLNPGEARTDLRVALLRNGSISGTILLDGDPVSTPVTLCRRAFPRGRLHPQRFLTAESSERGTYRIPNVPPGRYWVMASQTFTALPELLVADRYYGGTSDWTKAQLITITAGQSVEGIDIALESTRSFRLEGRIDGLPTVEPNEPRNGRPPLVHLQGEDDSITGDNHSVTSVNPQTGRFEFAKLRPGHYRLMAEADVEDRRRVATQEIDLSSDVEDLALRLAPAPALKGKVRLEGALAAQMDKLQVRLSTPSGSAPVTAKVNPDGSFLFPSLTPAIWDIDVTPLPDGAYYQSMRLDKEDVLNNDMVIRPGNTAELTIVLAAGACRIQGTLPVEERDPKTRFVTLVPEQKFRHDLARWAQAVPDDRGRFTLKRLMPGRYILFAVDRLPLADAHDPEVWAALESYGKPVELKPGDALTVQPEIVPAEAIP